ncbi:MAG: DNA methylase [Erysipelotrichaceae bacterium]|nr:DNA methylase [Erysipelotrichaceae bacterium]
MSKRRIYAAIDLKSFYASVECHERNLDALNTNLVVADKSRTSKTICLAVSPSLKKYGIGGRARLYEVEQKVEEINNERRKQARYHQFVGESYNDDELMKNKNLKLTYIVATPRMAYYIDYSNRIYEIYLKYFSADDIHVYSIDEIFVDLTGYLQLYHKTPKEIVQMVIQDIYQQTKITATAGIGTNLYLCKVAMDIVAKHLKADKNGVRIAQLDEQRYHKYLWNHKPITDFWRVGKGYANKLEKVGLYTMGDIAKCSMGSEKEYYNEDLLYKLFGVNAELLIDHAWGYEPCTIADIKSYKPEHNSIGNGQVLSTPYSYDKAKIVVKEMMDSLALDLVEKRLVTKQIVLTINYDKENVVNYKGEITTDHYGRKIPKHAHGTTNLDRYTSSSKLLTEYLLKLYDRIVDKGLTIRKINISLSNVISEDIADLKPQVKQLDIFSSFENDHEEQLQLDLEKEKRVQEATLEIKKKFGKNAILKGRDFEEGAKAKERNETIGGHKA